MTDQLPEGVNERDRLCPVCEAEGPLIFVRYNAKGAIVECQNVRTTSGGFTMVCRRRRQVDLPARKPASS